MQGVYMHAQCIHTYKCWQSEHHSVWCNSKGELITCLDKSLLEGEDGIKAGIVPNQLLCNINININIDIIKMMTGSLVEECQS